MLDKQKLPPLRKSSEERFDELQSRLNGSGTDPINLIYDKQANGAFIRKDESSITKIIANRLTQQCVELGLNVTTELHQRDGSRTNIGVPSNNAGQNFASH